MKKYNEIVQFILILLVSFTIPFLLAAFVQWDINPKNWDQAARGITVFGIITVLMLSIALWMNNFK